jgi:hypothetical protein
MRMYLNLTAPVVAFAMLVGLTGCDSAEFADGPAVQQGSVEAHGPTFLRGGGLRPGASGAFASPLFGLATAPNGDVLVADAGSGISNRFGHTEIAMPGVADIGPIGRGSMWAVTGASSATTGEDVGQGLYRVSPGRIQKVANLFAHEQANNPDGMGIDSNPYAVASLGGNAALVVDAAGNTLLRVNNRGQVETLAVFPVELVSTDDIKALAGCPESEAPFCALPPMLPAESVPTSVAIGPDGYYYVGELIGFPAPTGVSSVYRVSPNASGAMCGSSPDCVRVFEGFTSIIDVDFSPDGKLHVVEFDAAGWAAVEIFGNGIGGTINSCDLSTLTCEMFASGIDIITAITFGKNGTLWATRNALIPGLAEVVQVP